MSYKIFSVVKKKKYGNVMENVYYNQPKIAFEFKTIVLNQL